MKKLAFFLIPLTLVYTSCPPAIIYQHNTAPSGVTYREYPISIEIQCEDISKGIEVFEADVSVYRMNNRTDPSLRLDKTYNLIIQEAYGERVTRIDYTDGRPAEYRSMISFGDNIVLFNPGTEEISYKINIQQPQNPAYRLLSSQNYLSKINLSLIRQEAMRIALDIQTDDANTLTLALPPDLVQLPHGDRRISTKIAFDVKDEVLASTETVTMTAGGARVTVTVTPRYEMVDGTPVKTGQITVTQVDIPQTLDVPYEGVIYNSPDEIPTISREEYETLRRKGSIYERAGLVFGNPGDLSYVETEVELYNTVKVNHAPVMAYKLPLWVKVAVSIFSPTAGAALIIADAIVDTLPPSPVPIPPSPVPIPPPMPDGHRDYEDPVTGTPPVTPGKEPVIEQPPSVSGELLAKVKSDNVTIKDDKGKVIESLPYYYFDGFDFYNYKASKNGITDIIKDEYKAIKGGGRYTNKDSGKEFNVDRSDGPYVIVGHSEGGLRALGYASYIKKEDPDEFKKLKGVITISGANKGFKALEGGFNVFKYKLYSFIDVIANGLNALNILEIEPSLTNLYSGNYPSAAGVNFNLQNPAVRLFLDLIPGPLSIYIVPVLSTNNYDDIAEIRDLVPFSQFANTYVADAKVEIRKRITGTIEKLELFPFPHIVIDYVFEYYSVYDDEKIQFGEKLPVAYIIGTDNNTLGMINNSDLKQASELKQAVEKTIATLAISFEVAEIYYDMINCSTFGLAHLLTNTYTSSQNARRAKKMFKDFNGALHGLLGSTENDGLLAQESMEYKSGNVFDRREIEANHVVIKDIKTTETWDAVRENLVEMLK